MSIQAIWNRILWIRLQSSILILKLYIHSVMVMVASGVCLLICSCLNLVSQLLLLGIKRKKIVGLGLIESLHKRITYLKGDNVVILADYAKKHKKSTPAVLNAARRQNIPAFREKGVWKIGESFRL